MRPCNAEEPYREWLDFFEGQWTVNWGGEWDPPLEFRYTRGRFALIAEVTDPEGNDGLAVYAWDAGKNALVFSWFDSKGTHVRQEHSAFKPNQMSGLMYRSGPEGEKTGSAMVQRFGADKFKVTSDGSTSHSVLSKKDGKWTRTATLCRRDGTEQEIIATLVSVSEDRNVHTWKDSRVEGTRVYRRVSK